jgi:hypothetical protein
LSNITTSYQFHKELESPVAFARREWKALAVFGGGFVLMLFVAVLTIDPAFFYPRLSTDPLLYWLKGLAFAQTGHTIARTAVNMPPFHYVALPGVLRAPLMLAFTDFDRQLRAIQLSNVLLLAATAAMYAYVFSWAVPRKWHWLAIGFSFGFMLLSPHWVANVFEPLADAPYAAFTVAFVILSARVLSSDRSIRTRPWATLAGIGLFVSAFLSRFTAPVLLPYAAVLGAGRKRHRAWRPGAMPAVAAAVVAAVAVLVALSWKTISLIYMYLPMAFLRQADGVRALKNLLFSALPSQIIPVFNLGFARQPIADHLRLPLDTPPGDIGLAILGLAISAATFSGMWLSRKRFAPEIAYCLTALPVLMLISPSTIRYLMAYQPFFWIFFYTTVSVLAAPMLARVAAKPAVSVAGVALLVTTGGGLAYVRSQRVHGSNADGGSAISIGASPRYIHEVTSTFRSLRTFLETLPRDRTLLVAIPGSTGRWKVISGLDYYRPDSTLSVVVAQRDAYLLEECGTIEECQDFPAWDGHMQRWLQTYGDFSYDLVFSKMTPHGKAVVYRIHNRQ